MPDSFLSLRKGGGFVKGILARSWSETDVRLGPNDLEPYTEGETSKFEIMLTNGAWATYYDTGVTAVTWTLNIGFPDLLPVRGEFRLGTGAATGTAVSFNATTTQLLAAVSGALGPVHVTTFGSAITAGYIITAATANTSFPLLGQSLSLTPASTVEVTNLVTHASGVTAQHLVRLRRNAIFTLTNGTTASPVSFPAVSASGPSSVCGPWLLTRPTDSVFFYTPLRLDFSITGAVTYDFGQYVFFGPGGDANLADTTFGEGTLTRRLRETRFSTSTSAGGRLAGNTSVSGYFGNSIRDILDFNVSIAQNGVVLEVVNVITGLTVAVTGQSSLGYVIGFRGLHKPGVITFTGAALEEAFREARRTTITPTLEVTLQEDGRKTSLGQIPVTIRRKIG